MMKNYRKPNLADAHFSFLHLQGTGNVPPPDEAPLESIDCAFRTTSCEGLNIDLVCNGFNNITFQYLVPNTDCATLNPANNCDIEQVTIEGNTVQNPPHSGQSGDCEGGCIVIEIIDVDCNGGDDVSAVINCSGYEVTDCPNS
jgi:hypothetical protein